MSLQNVLQTVSSAVQTYVTGFNSNNVSVGDESVFAYVETDPASNGRCCIIEYNGFSVGRSEFSAITLRWNVLVNGFFLIESPDPTASLAAARKFVDEMVVLPQKGTASPTLDGTSISSVSPVSGETFLVYDRAGRSYILVSLTLEALDNYGG